MTASTDGTGPTLADTTARPQVAHRQSVAQVLALAWRQFDYWLTVYRRTWKGSVVSSFLLPVLYLVSMGVGLGSFIDTDTAQSSLGGMDYIAFISPGLLAATAMQTAVSESTYPVFGNFKWTKVYLSMVATPLTVSSVLVAHLCFVLFRLIVTCAVFLVVLALFGLVPGVWVGLAALAVAVLVGMAYTAPVFAYAAAMEQDSGFALLFRLGVMPMFLFSGAFFPVSQLPNAIEWLAYVNPLWHGVELSRMLTHTGIGPLAALNLAYLLALLAGGAWLAQRTFTRRLAG